MLAMAKRTLQINVRMSNEDLALLQKAAVSLWPGVELDHLNHCALAGKEGSGGDITCNA